MPRATSPGVRPSDAVCGTARKATSQPSKADSSSGRKARSVTPAKAGYACATGVPANASEVTETSWKSG